MNISYNGLNNQINIPTHKEINDRCIQELNNEQFEKVINILNTQCASLSPSTCGYLVKITSTGGYVNIFKVLVQKAETHSNIDLGVEDNFALREACKEGKTEIVEMLLDYAHRHPKSTVNPNTLFIIAGLCNRVAIALLLLKYGESHPEVDPSVQDNEPFKWALHYGHVEFLELLMRINKVRNSLKDDTKSYLFRKAIEKEWKGIFYDCLKNNFLDPSNEQNIAIWECFEYNRQEFFSALIQNIGVYYTLNHTKFLKCLDNPEINENKRLKFRKIYDDANAKILSFKN